MAANYNDEERGYIEYYMWRHGANMTIKEIARELGVAQNTVYNIAHKYGIKTIFRNDHDINLCNQRPQACFRCTASECRFAGACSPSEAQYLYAGLDDEGMPRKQYKRTKARE